MDRRLQKKHAKTVRRNALKSERAAAEAARRRTERVIAEDTELVVRLTENGRREFANAFPARMAGASLSDD